MFKGIEGYIKSLSRTLPALVIDDPFEVISQLLLTALGGL